MPNPIFLDCLRRPDSPGLPAIARVVVGDFVRLIPAHPPASNTPVWVRVTAVNRPPKFAGPALHRLTGEQLNQFRYTGVADHSDPASICLPEGEFQFLPQNICQTA